MLYHLLVTCEDGAWDKNTYSFEIGRVMCDYTEADLASKYKSLTKSLITELKSFPAVFAYETPSQILAKIGYFTRVEVKAGNIEIEYEFFLDSPLIPVETFSNLSKELCIGKLEMYRTHWTVKKVDLVQVLASANILTKEAAESLSKQLAALKINNLFKDTLESGEIQEMPKEERQNSGLALLMLLTQAYYHMLSETTSLSSWATYADLELNHSYLWVTSSLKKLITNHPDLKDFPEKFEPILENLLPSTIGNIDWQEMLAPDVEQFLGQIQKYYMDKGGTDLEKESAGWIFVELYRPSIENAVDQAIAYKKKVAQYVKQTFPNSQPKSTDQNHAGEVPVKNAIKKETASDAKRRTQVFISYSHKDKKIINDLRTHLKTLERNGCTVWSDTQIAPGSQWMEEIKKALSVTKVAVLLVTKDFLASDFINDNELNPLLKAAKDDGVVILWVLVRDCNWKRTPIQHCQAAYPTEKPLMHMKNAKRDTAWVAICDKIDEAINKGKQ